MAGHRPGVGWTGSSPKGQDLQPDLIVLDIGLPTINGIEAARRMRTAAPDSKILFLSENSSVEIAEEAFRTGATGYVVKSTAAQELSPALDAVLQGDRFVGHGLADRDRISLRDGISGRRCHQIEFYKGDFLFVDDFATTIEAALRTGSAMVVIASESHLAIIEQRLRSDGVDVDAAVERKSYMPLESLTTPSRLLTDMPPGGQLEMPSVSSQKWFWPPRKNTSMLPWVENAHPPCGHKAKRMRRFSGNASGTS